MFSKLIGISKFIRNHKVEPLRGIGNKGDLKSLEICRRLQTNSGEIDGSRGGIKWLIHIYIKF